MASREITCECGRTWKLTKVKTIMRDKDSFDCICGKELIEWNGGHTWTGKLVSGKDSK